MNFPEKTQVSMLLIANMDCGMTERLTTDSLDDVSWVQKAALQPYRRNVPLFHKSKCVNAHDSVLPGLPPR